MKTQSVRPFIAFSLHSLFFSFDYQNLFSGMVSIHPSLISFLLSFDAQSMVKGRCLSRRFMNISLSNEVLLHIFCLLHHSHHKQNVIFENVFGIFENVFEASSDPVSTASI